MRGPLSKDELLEVPDDLSERLKRKKAWVGVSLLDFDLAHGVGQSDPDALCNLAGAYRCDDHIECFRQRNRH